jgi:hypothetical protein
MTGFFEFDLDSLPPGHKATTTRCPNCNSAVAVTSVPMHECNEAALIKHHVNLLLSEFKLDTVERNCLPDPDELDRRDDGLYDWVALKKWCDSNEGQFEIEYARRTRP